MGEKLIRVGTVYVPVQDCGKSAEWYVEKLGAEIAYQDDEKAILNLAGQSFFLVRALNGETANFTDRNGQTRFCLTFEVDGLEALYSLHRELGENGVGVKAIEDRGHAGENFVFTDPDGNLFDVWSELSPTYKRMREAVLE